MLYKDNLKRYVLFKFKDGFEKGLEEADIIKILPILPGTEEEKQQLFMDCKVYLFLSEAFKQNQETAIKLAQKYIEENKEKRDINLVDEKLYSMYIKNKQLDLASELLEQLLQKEPDNKWNISKKIQTLRVQCRYREVLEIIEKNYEILKNDPVIFDIQFESLYSITEENPKNIIDLFKRIPELDFGQELDKRMECIKKLKNYISKTYALGRFGKCKQDLRRARDTIKAKIEIEELKNELIKNEDNTDMSKAKLINAIIQKQRDNKQEIENIIETIGNETIKFLIKCQVEQLYGTKSKDIAEKVKKYLKNGQLDETSQKSVKILQNLLTGRLRNIYLHDDWVRFQNQCFGKILKGENKIDREEKQPEI